MVLAAAWCGDTLGAIANHQESQQPSIFTGECLMKSIPIIKCSNLERSVEFYTKRLGFQLQHMSSQLTGPVAGLTRDSAELELSVLSGDSVFGASVYMMVENVDELFREFLERGLDRSGKPESPVHQAPLDQTWGMREFYVRDPDGNTLRFRTPINSRT